MTYEQVRNKIADMCGVEFALNLTKPVRTQKLFYARMVVAYHLRMQGWIYEDIAYILNRNHSTIVYYIKKYNDEYQYNEEFRNFAEEILK